eukprot:7976577-Karenia_brevis.AAC.1
MTSLFEDASDLCSRYGAFDLRKSVVQVHKDFGPGIEAARRKVFPQARGIGDYFHMKQNVVPVLRKKLIAQ